jgi:hypothetical protein
MVDKLDRLQEAIRELQDLYDDPDIVTTADKLPPKENPYRDFMDRNPMAGGGRINFDGGGSPLQRLRQEIVDSMRPYAPDYVTEDQLQLVVKDITLDMTAEQAQESAKANFIKLFGMAEGGRAGYNNGQLVTPLVDGSRPGYNGRGGPRANTGGDRSQYIDYKARIKNPGQKFLDIAEKVHGNKPEYKDLKGFELWKELEAWQRSNIKQGGTTGEISGVGKLKKKQLSKENFIKLVNDNRDKTYNEFVEVLKDYKTKDNKPFTKRTIATRLNEYGLTRVFKKEPSKKDPTKKIEANIRRKANLLETESTGAAGTKKYQFHHIRQIAGGVPLTSDDVAIIDGSMNRAMQDYDKTLNRISEGIRKNNRLALEAMNAKNESAAFDYMKRVDELNESAEKIVNSAIDKLPKKYKNFIGFNQFTLPRDEYGLPIGNEPMIIRKVGGMPVSKDAIDLTTLSRKDEAIFRKIVKQQAEAGKTGPIKGLSAFMKQLKIRCGLANGVNCNMPQAYQKSIDELTQKAKQGDRAARAKLTNFTNKAAAAGKLVKNALGPLAIASEIAIEGGIALNKTLQTGVPLKTAFADSIFNLALGPRLQINKEAELAKEFAKGEDFAMAERGRRMMIPQSATADAQRLKKREEEMRALYPQYSDQQLIKMIEDRGFNPQDIINQKTTTRITPAVTSTLTGLDQLRTAFQEQDALQRIADAGGVANLANGGIAGLSGGDKSGPPPESGPNSQGLQGLMKRVKKL